MSIKYLMRNNLQTNINYTMIKSDYIANIVNK